jgi:15-cis-phytoene synthase
MTGTADLTLQEPTLPGHAVDACRDAIVRHSRSFTLASRLLPGRVRHEAWVLYAWCRRADDAIDGVPVGQQGEALTRLRAELDAVYEDGAAPADPTLAAFQVVVRRRRIPRAYADALLDGMAMDAGGQRYETMADLLRYCYRVAGTVGLMMCHTMGLRRSDALVHAVHLGMAMQLTNICRDVAEDWRLGRLYLPADRLARAQIGWLAGHRPQGALPEEARGPLAKVVGELLDEADAYYRSGDRGLRALSWRCAFAVATARAVYADIGRVLRRRGCDVMAGRARVSAPRKVWLVVRTLTHRLLAAPRHLLEHLRAGRTPRPPDRAFKPLHW